MPGLNDNGSFTIDWDSKASEVRKAATKAKSKEATVPPGGIREGDQYWDKIYEGYSWIENAFDSLKKLPHPSHSKSMADKMADIGGNNDMQKIMDGGDEVDKDAEGDTVDPGNGLLSGKALHHDVNHYISGWNGNGATSFRGFFNDIPGVIDNQTFVAKFLGVTMEANQGLLLCARQDAQNIPDATITALEAVGGGTNAEDGATKLSIVGAVATIATGLATLPAGGGAIVAGGLTILSGVSSGAALAAEAEKKEDENKISGDDVDSVLSAMMDAVITVGNKLTEGEDLLIDKLNSSTEVLQSQTDEFIAPAPKAFTGNGPEDFTPPSV